MVLGIIIGIVIIGGTILYQWVLFRYINEETFAGFKITASLAPHQKEMLSEHFRFYQYLPEKSKKLFEFRVAKFIRIKEFVPRNMTHVTEEMKVLIAASVIQLTFGFPRVFLSYFKYVIVYPDQFFSNGGQRYHKGEVNPRAKAIVLSWKHFVEGYATSEGINLGLHEMAHALQLENIVMNNEYDFLDAEAIKQWQKLASSEMEIIRNQVPSLFREYGASNHQEFFAVAVENFFEKPAEFSEYHYELYQAMANLLRQDPLLLYKKL